MIQSVIAVGAVTKALQFTPGAKVKSDRFKGVSGKWYEDAVISFYESRFINDAIISSHPLINQRKKT